MNQIILVLATAMPLTSEPIGRFDNPRLCHAAKIESERQTGQRHVCLTMLDLKAMGHKVRVKIDDYTQ